ncbi:quinol:cytochrome C oxidoreductase [Sinomicrobium kalidii]|uniref:quinol:cytochrome C oxidoreductase n=1 Tax=Sinomicrobium kalidii TaxID=2900738 RepID=UPI001E289885|nr:quinol:cytochrome C oxidoreductase [Sinomicrobium kalidii]UGU14309.1 quinol:cytochrome C oxidoreductase [Sinomicrobium kalidii]
MYTFSSKLRLSAFVLMIVGILGLGYGFLAAPGTVAEAKAMVTDAHHGGGHDGAEVAHDAHGTQDEAHAEHDSSHDEHLLHQLQNKPWAALYVAAFFFMMISLGVLAFYAIQRVSMAGWSPLLFRVMEGITAYLLPGAVLVFVILALSGVHLNHLFVWMDPEVVAHDELIQGKSGFLNVPFFLIRAVIYIAGWVAYRHFSRKFSIAQDTADNNSNFKRNFKISAGFLVFFLVSESMMSWDWIMSVDPHWYSTLFGWYVFASMFVSGITVIALITIYLKSRGYLEEVNNSHIHDLAKFMFGISIFWTYLWFSQFMLIWYSNIPEEVTYFVTRIEDYKLPFFGMVVLNFVFPVLVLMNSDYKRLNWFVVMTGIVILTGHYIDVYNMIMPATVGDQWFIGVAEVGGVLFFMGLFIYVVFTALTKAPLIPKRNPFIEESRRFHY